jgi:hypothetical protein
MVSGLLLRLLAALMAAWPTRSREDGLIPSGIASFTVVLPARALAKHRRASGEHAAEKNEGDLICGNNAKILNT